MWNDRRLARRAARGDQDAFAAIFQRYQQDLYRYCVAILGDRQDAQDALQNTMVKALRALPGERREIELKPWLYRVAHNESIELRRRARPSEPLDEDLGAPIASLEETAAERGRLRDLLADIGELSERHRGALVMRELGGLDFDQIGVALDTSPGAARQVLYEARRGLQQMSAGREMNCDAVTALLSDGDGRVARRRDVRAHLRDCSECRGFADGIHDRGATLAGIAPLPAVAAAAIAKGALASGGGAGVGAGAAGSVATGGGSAAAGGGAAGTAGSGGAGAAGIAGGAAAKVASTGAILKSTVAIVAVVGASAVAVDHSGLIHRGAKFAFAGVEATVPKVTLVVRKAYGGAYAVMGSKNLNGDINLAWPTAQIAVMGSAAAVVMLQGKQLAAIEDPAQREAMKKMFMDFYDQEMTSPYVAAERGYIDQMIEPNQTRIALRRALRQLATKQEFDLPKKHTISPL